MRLVPEVSAPGTRRTFVHSAFSAIGIRRPRTVVRTSVGMAIKACVGLPLQERPHQRVY